MSFVELSDGNRLYYSVEGDGDPVILLNGIMMTAEAWVLQRKALAEKFKVVSHDFLGQGQSSKPEEGYSLRRHCEDLLSLMDELQIEDAHLIGASYGGEVGLLFAAEYPEKVKTLTVAGSVSEIHPLLEAMGRSWMEAAKTEQGEAFFHIVAPLIYSEYFFRERGEWLKERAKAFAGVVTQHWFKAFYGLMEAFMELDLTPELGKIKAPTLVVAGAEDILKPPKYSRIITQGIIDSRLEIMETGHAIPLEDPKKFNSLVLDFLEENES